MKRIIRTSCLLLCIITMGLCVSCSKDSEQNYKTLIVGLWQVNARVYMEFTTGGSFVKYINGNVDCTQPYSISGNTLYIYYPNGNTIEQMATIVNLDRTYLELDTNGERLVLRRCS